jgi:hypothetical protein
MAAISHINIQIIVKLLGINCLPFHGLSIQELKSKRIMPIIQQSQNLPANGVPISVGLQLASKILPQ